jgi:hypothetical protein
VEAGVFEEQHVAVVERGDGLRRRIADAILRKGDRLAEMLG